MPFKSQAQRRFMHSQHPEIAKRFEEHTPPGQQLPERVQPKNSPIESELRKLQPPKR